VPGGGIALDGKRWVSCRPGFFLPVRVLSRLFRRLFLDRLSAAHKQLQFFGNHTPLGDAQAFAAYLAPLRTTEGSVYQKRPFGGPEAVLAYLSRYTHRVAIANSRLIAFDQDSITFKWKDYRIEGRDRYKRMTLATDEFIRRFLIHVLPKGFHRIRHYGLLAKTSGADNIARARELLAGPKPQSQPADRDATDHNQPACPCCGGRMIIIETFPRGAPPRHQPTAPISRIDTHCRCPSHAAANAFALFTGSPPPATALGRMSGCSVKPHNCPHSSAHQPLTQMCIPAGRRLAIVSYSITRSIRGTQIPIVRDEPPSSRFPRFPPLEAFRRRPPVRASPSVSGRHPKTFTIPDSCTATKHIAIGSPRRLPRSVSMLPNDRSGSRQTRDPRSPAEQDGDRDQSQTEAHEPETRGPPASIDVFCPVVADDEQQADHAQV